jgi:hypothetical protein
VVEAIDPKAKEELAGKTASQHDLIDQVVSALGDTWCLFDSPGEGGTFTGVTAVVSLKDPRAAAAAQQKLLDLVESEAARVPERRRTRVEKFTFAHQTVHVFEAGQKGFPLAPAWCLTDKHLIVAAYPEAIKGFLARGGTFRPLAQAPAVAAALEGEGQAVALSYADTRRIFDFAYPLLPVVFHSAASEMRAEGLAIPPGLLPSARSIRPHLRPSTSVVRRTPAGIEVVAHQTIPGTVAASTLQVAVGLLVPAVQKTREAAARMQSSNNLKQIALAALNYESAYGRYPAAYSVDQRGKPLLSWRVHLLPFLEQDALYKEFHLDEPWDSPHNKKLIAKMPPAYRSPASAAAPGMTNYEGVRGKDTMFPGAQGVKIAEVTDGTANTILVVEVSDRKAVTWTRPDDFAFNDKNPADGLVGLWPGGFLAAFADGSVRFLSASINPQVLKDLFLRNDGHPLPANY